MTLSERQRFYLWHVGAALVAMALLVAVFEYTDLDRTISDLFYDPATQKFPLRRNVFLEVIMHQWAKYLFVVGTLGTVIAYGASFRIPSLRAQRQVLLFVALSLALGPTVVGAVKASSARHCPYDLEIYGGYAPHLGLFDKAPAGIKRGGCFPGGHSSGGFALMAFYFVWHRRRPKRAKAMLAAGFATGFIMGGSRLMQGAHFVSHNLWAAVLVWGVLLALYRFILDARDYPRAPAA